MNVLARTRRLALVCLLLACDATSVAPEDASADEGPDGVAPSTSDASTTPSLCEVESEHAGQATYYAADGSGNCSFDASPGDLDVAAMNHVDYAGSAACGGCVHVVGPRGEVTVRIVDQCPECPEGALDLSPQAFDRIADRALGRVAVRWQYVACDVAGPVRFRFKEGSSQWWTAVQVRNHRYPIAKLEVERDGSFSALPRESYNYFVAAGGLGSGPYTFRLTDVYGGQRVERNVALRVAQEVSGSGQLPACAP